MPHQFQLSRYGRSSPLMCLGKQRGTAQVIGPLSPTTETQVKILFSWLQSGPVQLLRQPGTEVGKRRPVTFSLLAILNFNFKLDAKKFKGCKSFFFFKSCIVLKLFCIVVIVIENMFWARVGIIHLPSSLA